MTWKNSLSYMKTFYNGSWPLKKYIATISYIVMIVLINAGFAYTPMLSFFGEFVSLMDPITGVVYLVRDFAQRELSHKVFIAMAVGAILSYFFATPMVAFASISAFIVGEIIDWAIFTFTQRPLGQRLIWSSCVSAPVDSFVFLYILGYANLLSFSLMTLGKVIGVFLVWIIWKLKRSNLKEQQNPSKLISSGSE